jgi:ABC-type transport system involved in cytochrome c biogenesis permease subunit
MTFMARHGLALVTAVAALIGHSLAAATRPRKTAAFADQPERGDVPGWVMITLMSAVLVAALLAVAGPALEAMFNQAMDTVGK